MLSQPLPPITKSRNTRYLHYNLSMIHTLRGTQTIDQIHKNSNRININLIVPWVMTNIPFPMALDFPPEAFTRKTLQQAFSWLQDQPEEVRDMIHTPERLVSLYQKSRRLKEREGLVKSEKFIHDLKNLVGHESAGNNALADQKLSSDRKSSNEKPGMDSPTEPTGQTSDQDTPKLHPASFREKPVGLDTSGHQNTGVGCEPHKKPTDLKFSNGKWMDLDPLSEKRVNEVMKRFNLDSTSEALRILVSLGFEKFSQFQ